MDKPMTRKGAERFWLRVKQYVNEVAYLKTSPPELYFDPETSSLYIKEPADGYDFMVTDGRLYDKEGTA